MRQEAKVGRVAKTRRVSVLRKADSDLPAVVLRELSDEEREREAREAEQRALLERLAPHHARMVQNYIEYSRGMYDEKDGHKLTDREILERAYEAAGTTLKIHAEQGRKAPLREVEWRELGALAEEDPGAALAKWEAVKQAARDELMSGFRSVDIAGESLKPFDRARFIALHEQLEEGWQPQNGVEHSLVDMLAQSLSLYNYWTQIAHARAVEQAGETVKQLYGGDAKYGYEGGAWPSPRQEVADAIEQAQRLADGYHRQYMRTLRQMRDLRRYAPPVIVNNGGQVNVAVDGGKQVNVAK